MEKETAIPCPFVYANGKRCSGHITRVEAYVSKLKTAIYGFLFLLPLVIGITACQTTSQTLPAKSVKDFVGHYDGYWDSNGLRGDADVWVYEHGKASAKLSFKIQTPSGEIRFDQVPDFDAKRGVLVNTSPNFRGTYSLTKDGMRIDYRRKGRDGVYILKRVNG